LLHCSYRVFERATKDARNNAPCINRIWSCQMQIHAKQRHIQQHTCPTHVQLPLRCTPGEVLAFAMCRHPAAEFPQLHRLGLSIIRQFHVFLDGHLPQLLSYDSLAMPVLRGPNHETRPHDPSKNHALLQEVLQAKKARSLSVYLRGRGEPTTLATPIEK